MHILLLLSHHSLGDFFHAPKLFVISFKNGRTDLKADSQHSQRLFLVSNYPATWQSTMRDSWSSVADDWKSDSESERRNTMDVLGQWNINKGK